MIEMGKKYKTRSGLPVRVVATDIKSPYPVVAALLVSCDVEIIRSYTHTGEFLLGDTNHPNDLIEVTLYDDFKEDDLCVVWNDDNKGNKLFRYFHKVNSTGKALCFNHGKTSFNISECSFWDNCRKPTEEEIKTKTIKD